MVRPFVGEFVLRKGIILAGGTGSRLWPITLSVSKQLLPVYDKPMIYYPLTSLMLAGIREIAIICTPSSLAQFRELLGDGSDFGIKIVYLIQESPEGLAQAYLIAEEFLDGCPSAMILGDNLFFGEGLVDKLRSANEIELGGTIFGYRVSDPERYGVIGFDDFGKISSIVEKPKLPVSNFAITGLYFFDNSAPARARNVKKSVRNEYEITSLIESYLSDGLLNHQSLGRGFAWLDTGTHTSLLDAGMFVRTIVERQGLQVGCPEEVAFHNGWIDQDHLKVIGEKFAKTEYGDYLLNIVGS